MLARIRATQPQNHSHNKIELYFTLWSTRIFISREQIMGNIKVITTCLQCLCRQKIATGTF